MEIQDLKKLMPEIFERVKIDVRKILSLHRAGLSLGLAEMEKYPFIAGMHFYPGYQIVMNKIPLKKS